MKRKLFSILIFCFLFSSVWSKNFFDYHPEYGGDFHAGIIVRNNFMENDRTFKTYGLRFEYPVGEHWYLNYDYHFIATSSGLHFSHMPICAYGVKYLLLYGGTSEGMGYTAALLMIVPEGVSYKINPGKKIQFVPYVNPLGINRMVFEREGQTVKKPWAVTLNTGLEIQSDLPWGMFAAADAGITYAYTSGKTIFGAGITIGMKFPELY